MSPVWVAVLLLCGAPWLVSTLLLSNSKKPASEEWWNTMARTAAIDCSPRAQSLLPSPLYNWRSPPCGSGTCTVCHDLMPGFGQRSPLYNQTKNALWTKAQHHQTKMTNLEPKTFWPFHRIGSLLKSIIPDAGSRTPKHWCSVSCNMVCIGMACHTQETRNAREQPVLQLCVSCSSGFQGVSCSGTSSELQEVEPQ